MTTKPQTITIGPVKLVQDGGAITAHHAALKAPVKINSLQLQRWLMRLLREQVQ